MSEVVSGGFQNLPYEWDLNISRICIELYLGLWIRKRLQPSISEGCIIRELCGKNHRGGNSCNFLHVTEDFGQAVERGRWLHNWEFKELQSCEQLFQLYGIMKQARVSLSDKREHNCMTGKLCWAPQINTSNYFKRLRLRKAANIFFMEEKPYFDSAVWK